MGTKSLIKQSVVLGFSFASLLMQIGCTQHTITFSRKTLNVQDTNTGTQLINVAQMSYSGTINGQQVSGLNVANLAISGDSLFITSTNIGAGVANLRQDPENPTPRWFAVNYQSRFPNGFTADGFFGTIAVQGSIFATSGNRGTILMINDSIPSVLLMRPNQVNQFGQLVADIAFIGVLAFYNNYLYVFKNEGYVLTYALSGTTTNPVITLVGRDDYDPAVNGYVTSAAVLNYSNATPIVHVAFGDRLVTYNIGSNGRLNSPTAYDGLRVSYVTKSANSVYLYNKPAYTGAGSNSQPEGLYQFTLDGRAVDYIPISASAMAIYNDSHVYYYDGANPVINIARIVRQN